MCTPRFRKRRQKTDLEPVVRSLIPSLSRAPGFSHMALHQHLRDARRRAEIPVDLERRMIIEKIRQRLLLKKRPQILVRLLPVPEPRIHVNDPRPAPARMPAAEPKPSRDGLLRRLKKLRRMLRDLCTGKKREQLGNMPVSGLCLFVVLVPLHDLPVPPDPDRRDTFKNLRCAVRDTRRHARLLPRSPRRQCFFSGNTGRKKLRNDLVVHGRTLTDHALFAAGQDVRVLRRKRRARYEVVAVGDEIVHDELRRLAHDRVVPA